MSNYTVEISGNQPYYIEVEDSYSQNIVNLDVLKENDITVEVSTSNTFVTFSLPSGYPLEATSGNLDYTRVNGLEDYIRSLSSESSSISVRIYNNSPYSIQRGQAVYLTGFNAPFNAPTASPYIANGTISEQLFCGLISDYTASGNYGYANNFGVLSNLNTTGSISNISDGNESWSVGSILYASPSDHGKLTIHKPNKNIIIVGIVTYAHASSGTILIRSSITPQLSQLNGVNFSGLSDSNILKYDSFNSQWSNYSDLDGGII